LEQQLAGAARLVVGPGALGVHGYVHAEQEHLAAAPLGERVDGRRGPGAQRLHLGAGERETRLEGVENRVVVPGPPVGGDDLAALFPRHRVPSEASATVAADNANASTETGGKPFRRIDRRA